MQQSPNNVLDFYRQRKKERENAAYFLSKGDELSARKALSKSAEIDYELVKKNYQGMCYCNVHHHALNIF